VKNSKQDKKSVPGRTDNLHNAGYIRKTRILAEKHNTSLLTHRRFIAKEELDVLDRPIFINGSLSFDNLLNVLKEKLKNGGMMKMEDLEEFCNCSVKSWEKKALWRALERLDIIGVVQRFRMDEHKLNKRGVMRIFKTRSIKLLREPTDEDFKRYTSLTVKDRNDFRKRLEAQDAEVQGEHAEYMEDDDYAPTPATGTETADQDAVKDPPAPLRMQWDSDDAWSNTVFNAINATGTTGLSSMAVREATFGRFYDRPVEQMLARLTDVWHQAQPDHLKHFSIIRDTDTKGRSTNYLYRSYEAFEKAVEAGNTVWENATNVKDYKKPVPKLDAFGFGELDQSHFLKNGTVSLADGIAATKFGAEKIQRADPVVGKKLDGSPCIVWTATNYGVKSGKSKGKKAVAAESDDDDNIPATPKKSRGASQAKGAKKGRPKKAVDVATVSASASAEASWSTEAGLRIQAENDAYKAAQKDQKKNLVIPTAGKEIVPKWQPGRGRPKMILVDDKNSADPLTLPEGIAASKRPPIIVLESRVQAILETLRRPSTTGMSTPAEAVPTTPQAKRVAASPQVVILKSPRFNKLSWFKDSPNVPTTPAGEGVAMPTAPEANGGDEAERQLQFEAAQADVQATQHSPEETDTAEEFTAQLLHAAAILDEDQKNKTVQVDGAADQDTSQPMEIDDEVAETPAKTPAENDADNGDKRIRKDWAQRQSTYIRPPPASNKHRKKKGTVVGRGTAQYKRILLIEQIIEKSGGIFPGDSEMVPAFQRLQKKELKSETTSDRDTIMKAVKALVDDGKLIRFAFYFVDRFGKNIQKWILHQPHISSSSPEVKDTMKKIEETHPRNYVPPPYGDGETGRAEQRKNIDRFQYRPGRSIIQPSGTDFVIDVEAKRRELEEQRLAAAAAIRAEENKRLKAQAARNKKRQAKIAGRPRQSRAIGRKTAQPDPWALDHTQEDDDPNRIMPSVEQDGMPINHRNNRPRYRDIRPAPAISQLDMAKLDSGVELDYGQKRKARPPLMLPGGQVLPSAPPRRGRRPGPKPATAVTSTKRGSLTFRPHQGPDTYDPNYDLQDISTLLSPIQRFHSNTGTFSTDFFIRTNVRHNHWVAPGNLVFEHHTATNPADVQWFTNTEDRDNFYHPDKGVRKPPIHTSKRQQPEAEQEYDSDIELGDAWYEKKELQVMREEFPDLIHEQPQDGFVSYTFGGQQQTAEVLYNYGIRPMEHVVLHGADPEDFQGVDFAGGVQQAVLEPDLMDIDSESEEEIATPPPSPPPEPKANAKPKTKKILLKPRRSRKELLAEYGQTEAGMEPETAEDHVLPPPPRPLKPSDRRTGTQSGKCIISPADARKLFFACIATRTICSEMDGQVTWGTIRDLFADHPNFDLPTFKARWNRMYHNYGDILRRAQGTFQDAFLAAYAKGQLPKLDVQFGNKLYYKDSSNWVRVVDWAVKNVAVFPEEIDLPSTREALSESFIFRATPANPQDMRDKMEHVYTTHAKREDLAHQMPFALPLRRKPKELSNVEVARSWIRANCATVGNHYNADPANQKVAQLGQGLVNAVTMEMHADKMIAHSFKSRFKAARNYHLSDQYNQIFNKRALDAGNFADALAFKMKLDEAFACGDPRLELDYNISEGAIMALTELTASGHIELKHILPPIDSTIGAPWPRLTVWGFTEGQYKLRNMDRKTFIWKLEVTPTKAYRTGLPYRTKAEQTEPPRHPKKDPAGTERIPLWYDLLGNFLPKFWERLLRSVVQHIAMKAGSSIATLAGPYRGLVWEWEIQLLVEWLVEVGVAEQSESGGVTAKDGWWMVVPNKVVEDGEDDDAGAGVDGAGTAIELEGEPAPKKRRVRQSKA
jgi:hypothetical protein